MVQKSLSELDVRRLVDERLDERIDEYDFRKSISSRYVENSSNDFLYGLIFGILIVLWIVVVLKLLQIFFGVIS